MGKKTISITDEALLHEKISKESFTDNYSSHNQKNHAKLLIFWRLEDG
jgi:predicted CopG family antitoxin